MLRTKRLWMWLALASLALFLVAGSGYASAPLLFGGDQVRQAFLGAGGLFVSIAGYWWATSIHNGTKLNSTPLTTTSYGDGTVRSNTTYTYKVEAVDGAGNKSAQSTAATITTPRNKRGDITGTNGVPDGSIDLQDISYVIRNYDTANVEADISGSSGDPDGTVDIYDLSYIIRNYGSTEP